MFSIFAVKKFKGCELAYELAKCSYDPSVRQIFNFTNIFVTAIKKSVLMNKEKKMTLRRNLIFYKLAYYLLYIHYKFIEYYLKCVIFIHYTLQIITDGVLKG